MSYNYYNQVQRKSIAAKYRPLHERPHRICLSNWQYMSVNVVSWKSGAVYKVSLQVVGLMSDDYELFSRNNPVTLISGSLTSKPD
jgi:hypothetical protein